MKDLIAVKYKKLIYGSFYFDNFGNGRIRSHREVHSLGTNGRIALLANQDDPFRLLRSKIRDSRTSAIIHPFNKIFIAPECKFRRDIFRNNGYTIVRKKEDAERIVVPPVKITGKRHYNIAVYDDLKETLELYYTVNSEYRKTINHDEDRETIKKYFSESGKRILIINFKDLKANFVSRCEEYFAIAELPDDIWAYDSKYISEVVVPFNNQPVQINVETLDLWYHCKDSNVLESAICNSNWQEYPITLRMFLKYCVPTFVPKNKTVYEILADIDAKSKEITPKDWDMLQQFALYRCNVSENGGFTNVNTFLDNPFSRFIKARVQAVKHPIQEETNFENLIESLR